jgi:hypothetical protein
MIDSDVIDIVLDHHLLFPMDSIARIIQKHLPEIQHRKQATPEAPQVVAEPQAPRNEIQSHSASQANERNTVTSNPSRSNHQTHHRYNEPTSSVQPVSRPSTSDRSERCKLPRIIMRPRLCIFILTS